MDFPTQNYPESPLGGTNTEKKQQRTACLCLFESWPSSGQILKYWGNLLYQAQLVPGHFDPHEKQPEQLWYF